MNGLVKAFRNDAVPMWVDFDKMMDSLFPDVPAWEARVPAVDIREEEGRYVLEAELPGLTEKDVEVKVEDAILTIFSSKNEDVEKKSDGFLLRERKSSAFKRSFVLPKDVDRENIAAKFKNGILSIELGKSPELQPKTIEVKSV